VQGKGSFQPKNMVQTIMDMRPSLMHLRDHLSDHNVYFMRSQIIVTSALDEILFILSSSKHINPVTINACFFSHSEATLVEKILNKRYYFLFFHYPLPLSEIIMIANIINASRKTYSFMILYTLSVNS